MRVALYLRVSTSAQTVKNQERELAAVAAARGWRVVETYCDEGISGAKRRDRRPGFDRLWKDAARREIRCRRGVECRPARQVARQNVATFMVDLKGYGVGLYLHAQAVDTTTPGGKALLQMAGVFAEFERGMIRERVVAGQCSPRPCYPGCGSAARPFQLTRQQQLSPISGRASASSSLRSFTASGLAPSRSSRRSWPLRRSSAPPRPDFTEERGNRRQQGGEGCNETCMVQWSPLSGKQDWRRALVYLSAICRKSQAFVLYLFQRRNLGCS